MQKKISPETSKKIAVMSSLSMLLVVMMHGVIVVDVPYTDSLSFFIFHTFTRVAVPLFFCISSFLFFQGIDTYKSIYPKIIKRTKSIFLPYVYWNAIAFAFFFVFSNLPVTKAYFSTVSISTITVSTIWTDFFTKPVNAPMWFLRDLYILFLCSPLIFYVYSKAKSLFYSSFLFVLVLWTLSIKCGIFYFDSLLFFLVGFILANLPCQNLEKKRIHLYSGISFLLFLIMSVALSLMYNNNSDNSFAYFQKLMIVFGIGGTPYSYSFIKWVRLSSFFMWFKNYSFIVFATHIITIQAFKKVILLVFPISSTLQYIIAYCTLITITVLFSVLIQKVLSFLPRLLGALTGGRS